MGGSAGADSPSISELLLPTKRQLITYSVLSVVILVINTGFMLDLFSRLLAASKVSLPLIHSVYQQASVFLNNDRAFGLISVGLIWGIVGAVVYGLFWIAGNMFGEVRNVMVEELYFVQPKPGSLWQGRFALGLRVLFRIGMFLLIGCLTMVLLSIILPYAMLAVRPIYDSPILLKNFIDGLVALLVLSFFLHCVLILVRILTRPKTA